MLKQDLRIAARSCGERAPFAGTKSHSTRRVVLIGPPGAGKGTQATRMHQQHGLAHISTGDMLREQIREGTPLGRQAQAIIGQGNLMPDQVMLEMLSQRLDQPDTQSGFILDGFPRSTAQAAALQTLLFRRRQLLSGAILLKVPDEVLVERLSLRTTCCSCGAVYHLRGNPPLQAGRCDRDGGELRQREDDCESVIRHRLSIYHQQTKPVAEFFQTRGLLHTIDATRPISQVELQLENILQSMRRPGGVTDRNSNSGWLCGISSWRLRMPL